MEAVPSAKSLASETIVNVSKDVSLLSLQTRRMAFQPVSWESHNSRNTGADGMQLLRPNQTPQIGSWIAVPTRSKTNRSPARITPKRASLRYWRRLTVGLSHGPPDALRGMDCRCVSLS